MPSRTVQRPVRRNNKQHGVNEMATYQLLTRGAHALRELEHWEINHEAYLRKYGGEV